MSLAGKPRAFIGLDLGTRYIKLVELIDRGPQITLTTYAIASRPLSQPLLSTIKLMLERARVSADEVILSSPKPDQPAASRLIQDLPRLHLNLAAAISPGRALAHLQPSNRQPHLICDIGARAANCYLITNQSVVHKLPHPSGIIQARQFLIDSGLTGDDILIGLKPQAPDRLKLITAKALRPLNQLIRRTSQLSDSPPHNITLTGGGALIPGLVEFISHAHHLPVSLLNPWPDISHSDGMDIILNQRGPQLSLAVALARSQMPI